MKPFGDAFIELIKMIIAPVIFMTVVSGIAAAVASGVVALMIQENRLDEGAVRPLTPNTVKALLQYTALALLATRRASYSIRGPGASTAMGPSRSPGSSTPGLCPVRRGSRRVSRPTA